MQNFIINLERDAERRLEISAQFKSLGMPYRIFNAVYGKDIGEAEMAEVYDHQRAVRESHDLTPGELGCALSHLGVYREMIEQNIACALVVEDDARLGTELPKVLTELERLFASGEPTVVLLNYVEKYLGGSAQKLNENHVLVKTYGGIPNAHGYFINLAAAKSLAKELYPIWAVADRWDKFSRAGYIRVRAVVPYCIGLTEHALDSNLDADRIQRMSLYKRGGFLYNLHRYLYQKFLYQIMVRPFLKIKAQKKTWC